MEFQKTSTASSTLLHVVIHKAISPSSDMLLSSVSRVCTIVSSSTGLVTDFTVNIQVLVQWHVLHQYVWILGLFQHASSVGSSQIHAVITADECFEIGRNETSFQKEILYRDAPHLIPHCSKWPCIHALLQSMQKIILLTTVEELHVGDHAHVHSLKASVVFRGGKELPLALEMCLQGALYSCQGAIELFIDVLACQHWNLQVTPWRAGGSSMLQNCSGIAQGSLWHLWGHMVSPISQWHRSFCSYYGPHLCKWMLWAVPCSVLHLRSLLLWMCASLEVTAGKTIKFCCYCKCLVLRTFQRLSGDACLTMMPSQHCS